LAQNAQTYIVLVDEDSLIIDADQPAPASKGALSNTGIDPRPFERGT
jgi:hypothetical protein